ncbi:lytic transglycosylase [Burkholderia lata]|uniref:Lytic transglycosylase n=2 Tax=Burkholderia lata (strain ATCC 17760 / DSM 23089 / LMG 22485 / NCIMB 9086 / R18194 / 383) TaxID=482957 RepID=A0A6P2JKI7_BURL3|nr:lytic transglycosylase [Burkholderia lata]VWC34796.1 lytic transglycosylase [Burkholderia lata]
MNPRNRSGGYVTARTRNVSMRPGWMPWLWFAMLLTALFVTPVRADDAVPGSECFERAAGYQGVNPQILRAIAWYESKGNPAAVHRNADGSIDVGQTQINSVHFGELRRNGVPPGALKDACVNIYVAAWMLKRKMVRYGNTWQAIGAYHSETPRFRDEYARNIHAVLVSWGLHE